jgi:H/ACA ribonucleoprotein complex subunit 4
MKMHGSADRARLDEVAAEFTTEVIQTPPVRSAVKRAPRTRRIHSLKILEVSGRNVLFRVECDSGTYVRSLCVDIGDAMGIGAHLQDLRRTRAGTMTEDEAVSLHDLRDALENNAKGESEGLERIMRPLEAVLDHLPKVEVKDSAVDAICHGADLAVPGILSLDDSVVREATIAIMTVSGEGVGLGKALMGAKEIMSRSDGLAAKTIRVFMPAGTYEKGWTSAGGRRQA